MEKARKMIEIYGNSIHRGRNAGLEWPRSGLLCSSSAGTLLPAAATPLRHGSAGHPTPIFEWISCCFHQLLRIFNRFGRVLSLKSDAKGPQHLPLGSSSLKMGCHEAMSKEREEIPGAHVGADASRSTFNILCLVFACFLSFSFSRSL